MPKTDAGLKTDEGLSETILRLANHYGDPRDLFHALRKAHPESSKKDVALAALAVMIDRAETDSPFARPLHPSAEEKKRRARTR